MISETGNVKNFHYSMLIPVFLISFLAAEFISTGMELKTESKIIVISQDCFGFINKKDFIFESKK